MGLSLGDFLELRTGSAEYGKFWSDSAKVDRLIGENPTSSEILVKQIATILEGIDSILEGTSPYLTEILLKIDQTLREPNTTEDQRIQLQDALGKINQKVNLN